MSGPRPCYLEREGYCNIGGMSGPRPCYLEREGYCDICGMSGSILSGV